MHRAKNLCWKKTICSLFDCAVLYSSRPMPKKWISQTWFSIRTRPSIRRERDQQMKLLFLSFILDAPQYALWTRRVRKLAVARVHLLDRRVRFTQRTQQRASKHNTLGTIFTLRRQRNRAGISPGLRCLCYDSSWRIWISRFLVRPISEPVV